jgi:hypothetical protein
MQSMHTHSDPFSPPLSEYWHTGPSGIQLFRFIAIFGIFIFCSHALANKLTLDIEINTQNHMSSIFQFVLQLY